MLNREIKLFKSGTQTRLDSEVIPTDAASSSQNWVTVDGALELVRGKIIIGSDLGTGKIQGHIFGYKVDGTKVQWQKSGTEIRYWDGSSWVAVVTGLTSTAEYTFANYSSLAGAFTYAFGADGIYKFNNANPGSYCSMYDSSKNFKGNAIIDKGRTILWNRTEDKTGLYGSKIDLQNSTVYTTVAGEATTSLTGTLAFKAGGATRNCFGVQITITANGEVYTDSYLGTLTGSLGGTGTINYITGAYTLSNPGVGTAGYKWEDSNIKGVTDFSHAEPRIAGEGFRFPQDEGGDAIVAVQIGTDGNYYSLKTQSVYQLAIDPDDTTATNQVYRRNIGTSSLRGSVATGKGVVFMNLANAADPQLTILQKNQLGDNIEPVNLFQQFKFADYYYDDCAMKTWDRFIMVACRTRASAENDTILLCDQTQKSVDVVQYSGRTFADDGLSVYMGSALSRAVYQIFDGFDDDGDIVENAWVSKSESYGDARLKKVRKLRLRGLIDPNQSYEIYANYDGAGFSLIGTVLGTGDYVDESDGTAIGEEGIGQSPVGGGSITDRIAYPYYLSLRIKTPKFRVRQWKFKALGYGYVNIQSIMDEDIFMYEFKIPPRFRQKENVSLDGMQTDLSTPEY